MLHTYIGIKNESFHILIFIFIALRTTKTGENVQLLGGHGEGMEFHCIRVAFRQKFVVDVGRPESNYLKQ